MQTGRPAALTGAPCGEDEVGETPRGVGAGGQRAWERCPSPDGPSRGGSAGGYGRHWETKKRHFEGIVGNSTLAGPRANDHAAPARKRLGCGPTLATNSQQRRGEVWQAPGVQRPQPSPGLSEGRGDGAHAARCPKPPG